LSPQPTKFTLKSTSTSKQLPNSGALKTTKLQTVALIPTNIPLAMSSGTLTTEIEEVGIKGKRRRKGRPITMNF
jgi:hypothetical protein